VSDASGAYVRALAAARKAWGENWKYEHVWRAPGRLELLGNHIDYNGGPVLAAAIDRDTVCLIAPGSERGISVLLSDVSEQPENITPETLGGWSNSSAQPEPIDYVRGVIAAAIARGVSIRQPVELVVAGDVPIGLGLSSSASLCVALTIALHVPSPEGKELVLRAQEAEHRAGTPCGTMDQSASTGGNVILYDGRQVSWSPVAPDLGSYVFAVADSGVSRSLATSSYPRRVDESQEALILTNRLLGTNFQALAELEARELAVIERASDEAIPGVLKRRIRHIVTETARVRDGVEALNQGDWRQFGALMSASGRSSAIDYEISHPQVEELVASAIAVPGVAGARMMGGGEGGIALILLEREAVPGLRSRLFNAYYSRYPVPGGDPIKIFRFAQGAGQYP
jgi:galactokinase